MLSIKWIARLLAYAILSVFLIGCEDDKASRAELAARAMALSPSDVALKEIYERSCKTCHAVAETGAPLTGDAAGWQPRMAQGMDKMVDHVIAGFGGMPPFGLCMDCDAEQFEALIRFMAEAQ